MKITTSTLHNEKINYYIF